MTRKRFVKLLMGRFLYDSDAPETVYKGAWDALCEEEEEQQCE